VTSTRATRFGLLAISIVAIFSAITGTAAAAEAPELEGIAEFNTSISNTRVEAKVNPEGAATTYQVEFRESGKSESWSLTPPQAVGSGTSFVPVITNFTLKPESSFELRLFAKNSFGTTRELVTKNFASPSWSIEGASSSEFASSSSGTWKVEWFATGSEKLECAQHGSGTIGNPGGVGDTYTYTIDNCTWYINGFVRCQLTGQSWSFTMNGGTFKEETGEKFFHCPNGELHYIRVQEPKTYSITMPDASEPRIEQPLTLTLPVKIDNKVITATINTNWFLIGANEGRKFSVS
jgi:hypothetical protein